MKVVISTTVPGPKKWFVRPPEANIEDIVKTFEMGTYLGNLDVFSKFSNAYGLRYHD